MAFLPFGQKKLFLLLLILGHFWYFVVTFSSYITNFEKNPQKSFKKIKKYKNVQIKNYKNQKGIGKSPKTSRKTKKSINKNAQKCQTMRDLKKLKKSDTFSKITLKKSENCENIFFLQKNIN